MFARIPHRHPLWKFGDIREGRAVNNLSLSFAVSRCLSDNKRPGGNDATVGGVPRGRAVVGKHHTLPTARQERRRAPTVSREDYIQRLKKGLCTRCGSEEHRSDQCEYLPPHPLHDTLHSRPSRPLGSFAAGEDQIREAVLGEVIMPSRYRFLHEPSPTRNTKSVGGQITTSPTVEPMAETSSELLSNAKDCEVNSTSPNHQAHDCQTATMVGAGLGGHFEAGHIALHGENGSSIAGNKQPTIAALEAKKDDLIDGVQTSSVGFGTLRRALQRAGMSRTRNDRVHFIGTHELGKLAAHSFASMPRRPPITLLMHSEELLRKWRAEGEAIVLVRDDKADTRIGFDVERTSLTQAEHGKTSLLGTTRSARDDNPWLIKQLIVSDNAWKTLPALYAIRDRLDANSTIMFLQDIEGIIDRVNIQIFQNPSTRPQYIRAHSSHGLMNHPTRTFAVKHYKQGQILLAHAGEGKMADLKKSHPTTFDLIDAFECSPALVGMAKPTKVLLLHKLPRLAVDSVLGPLSVVFDCKILDLRYNYMVTQNLREMLTEICAVIHKMPELSSLRPIAMKRFSVMYLEKTAAEVCNQLQQDEVHPMAKLVQKGRRTDIEFRNGYFIEMGKRLGVEMPVNLSIMRLVKAKQAMNQKRAQDWIPFDNNPHPKSKG